MVRLDLSHPWQESPSLIRLTLQPLLQQASVPSSQTPLRNKNRQHRKQLDPPKMESSNRRLAFDSCDEDYECCDSVQGPIANNVESESYLQVTPSPFRAPQSPSSNYTIHEMTEDLLCPDGISGITTEEVHYTTAREEHQVIPQNLDDFRKITGLQKAKIIFKAHNSTQIIS